MNPLDYLRVLRRRWILILVACYIGTVAAILTAPAKPPPSRSIREFRASAVLLAGPTGQTTPVSVANLAFLVTTGDVPRRVAKVLGTEEDPALLARKVQATGEATLSIIRVSSAGADGPETARLANTFANELMRFLEERQLTLRQQQVDDALGRMKALEASVAERDAKAAAGPARVEFIKAERDALIRQYGLAYDRLQQLIGQAPPTSGLTLFEEATPLPVFRSTVFRAPSSRTGRAGIGAVLGLLLGIGLAFAIQRLDLRVYSKERAEVAFDLPVIAEIPSGSHHRRRRYEIEVVSRPSSNTAVSYRRLRTSTLLMRVLRQTPLPFQRSGGVGDTNGLANGNGHGNGNGSANGSGSSEQGDAVGAAAHYASFDLTDAMRPAHSSRVLLMSAPGDKEDGTAIAANLAASFAQMGQSVLVLSCSFARARIHHYFGVPDAEGIREVLAAPDAVLRLEDFLQETTVPGVSLVTHGIGTESPAELVRHGPALVRRARELADVVVIDAGPLLVGTEAGDLAPYVDAVILTARVGRTTIDRAQRSTELLGRLGAPVLGVVLVGDTGRIRGASLVSLRPQGRAAKERPAVLKNERVEGRQRMAARSAAVPMAGFGFGLEAEQASESLVASEEE